MSLTSPQQIPTTASAVVVLAVHARGRACALHIADVIEVMRPLPIERLPGVPTFLLGLAIVRGVGTPVIDLGALVGSDEKTMGSRFVTVRAGSRVVALLVDDVIGTLPLGAATLNELPRIFDEASEGLIERLGVLDGHLLALLQAGRLLPDNLHAIVAEADPASANKDEPKP